MKPYEGCKPHPTELEAQLVQSHMHVFLHSFNKYSQALFWMTGTQSQALFWMTGTHQKLKQAKSTTHSIFTSAYFLQAKHYNFNQNPPFYFPKPRKYRKKTKQGNRYQVPLKKRKLNFKITFTSFKFFLSLPSYLTPLHM